MFTTIIFNGVLKVVQLIRYRNNQTVARIFDPREAVPERVLDVDQQGRMLDDETGKTYKINIRLAA